MDNFSLRTSIFTEFERIADYIIVNSILNRFS